MGSENGRPGLRGLYTDPARPLTVPTGLIFDLVSMPSAVGTVALETLRARRVRLGPVVADLRSGVKRVGFLVPPQRTGQDGAAGLWEWVARLGSALGVRAGGRGSTATLPPLFPAWHDGWLRWLVPPEGPDEPGTWTSADALLAALHTGLGLT